MRRLWVGLCSPRGKATEPNPSAVGGSLGRSALTAYSIEAHDPFGHLAIAWVAGGWRSPCRERDRRLGGAGAMPMASMRSFGLAGLSSGVTLAPRRRSDTCVASTSSSASEIMVRAKRFPARECRSGLSPPLLVAAVRHAPRRGYAQAQPPRPTPTSARRRPLHRCRLGFAGRELSPQSAKGMAKLARTIEFDSSTGAMRRTAGRGSAFAVQSFKARSKLCGHDLGVDRPRWVFVHFRGPSQRAVHAR
jgi:hypothetical protein